MLSKTKLRALAKDVIGKRIHIVDKVKELVEEDNVAMDGVQRSTLKLSKKIQNRGTGVPL